MGFVSYAWDLSHVKYFITEKLGMQIKLKNVLKREFQNRKESINEIAKNCEIPTSTLHNWVQGVLPTAKNLYLVKTLGDYLGLSISKLLFDEDEEDSRPVILFSSTFIDDDQKYKLVIEKVSKK